MWLRVTGAVVVAALVAIGIGAVIVFGGAPDPIPEQVDAIVALAGTDERARTALELFEDGVADTLLVSVPYPADDADAKSATARRICADPPSGVRCVTPVPPTTRGEVAECGRWPQRRDGTRWPS